ncbi:MAG: hypothetical protein AAGA56_17340 [Myxococcota bacterium]
MRELDESPQRILLVGDSMVENLKFTLHHHAAARGHHLTVGIWYASTLQAWAGHSHMGELLSLSRATVVIMVNGASESPSLKDEVRVKLLRQLQRRIGDRPLLWIGPPTTPPFRSYDAWMAGMLPPNTYFPSSRLSLPRERDGIHPTPEAGASWARAIVTWIERTSAHPIALTPTDPSLLEQELAPPMTKVIPPPFAPSPDQSG